MDRDDKPTRHSAEGGSVIRVEGTPRRAEAEAVVAAAPGYGYFWWIQDDRSPPAFFARGMYGQHLYVVPGADLVLVRFGRDRGYPNWPQLLSDLARRLEGSSSGKAS
jgi:CubicO group peptidase (beta-lactamase class C family)